MSSVVSGLMSALLSHLPPLLVATAGRAAVLVLAGWLLAALLARAAAGTRRLLWAGVLVAALLLPAAGQLLPPLVVPMLPAATGASSRPPPALAPGALFVSGPGAAVAPAPAGPVSRAGTSVETRTADLVLGVLWMLGFLVVLARAVAGQLRAARLVARARPLPPGPPPVGQGIAVRSSAEVDLPMTIGLIRPVVVLPAGCLETWPAARRQMVLSHEAAHVRGRDPLLQLAAELACALHWYNPLVWLAAHRLRVERELAADDAALLAGTQPSEYARCLLELSEQSGQTLPPPTAAVVSLLHPAGLKARLLGVLDGRRRRGGQPVVAGALALAGAALFLSVARAVPVGSPDTAPSFSGPPADGPIVGRAIEAGSGRALAGVEVDLYLQGRSPASAVRVSTDGQGAFRLPRTGPTPARLVAYLRHRGLAARTPVLAPPAPGEQAPTIELGPAPTVTGTVRGEAREPLAGARLRFVHAESWAVSPGWAFEARSDEEGGFRLQGILQGDYRLVVQSVQGTFAVELVRVGTSDPVPFAITVPRQQPVTGRLLDAGGAPIAGVRLTRGLLPPLDRQRYFGWDETAADGSFRMLPLGQPIQAQVRAASGEVLFRSFSDTGPANVVDTGAGGSGRLAGVTPPGGPRTVVLHRAAFLRGTVRWPDGRPASGAIVFGIFHAGVGSAGTTTVDAGGRYRVGPLEPGLVSLFAHLPGQRPALGTDRVVRALATAADEREVDLVLHYPMRPTD